MATNRSSSTSITNLLTDLTDDIKAFIDDEVIDRGRGLEKDARHAVRRVVADRGDVNEDSSEVAELRAAVADLTEKLSAVNAKAAK